MHKRAGDLSADLSNQRIGCALSHVNIYRDILANNYKNALVLEDDVDFKETCPESLRKGLSELPDDWDLLYLGYLENNTNFTLRSRLRLFASYIVSALNFKSVDPEIIRNKFPRDYSEHIEIAGFHFGTHAYGVSAKGAIKILQYQLPVVQESDNAISELAVNGWIQAFSLRHRFIDQNDNLPSTIVNDN